MATLRVNHPWRLTLLWSLLLMVFLLYAETGRLRASHSLLHLARGALIG